MNQIGTIKLDDGKTRHGTKRLAYIKQFPKFLTYHTRKGTCQIGYTIGEDEYILDRIAHEVGPKVRKKKFIVLSEQESAPIVLKVRDILRKHGFAVSANVAE